MELTFEEREQKILESTGKIFEVFDGMTKEYVKLIREHHKVVTAKTEKSESPITGSKFKGKMYSDEYISQHRAQTKEAVKQLKKVYIDKAKEVINSIKEKYGVKAPEPPKVPNSPDEQMRYQLERNNNIILWKAQLEAATVKELRELHQEYQNYPDFMILFKAELKKREKSAELTMLISEVENPPKDKAFESLNKIEIALNSLNQMNYFPVNLKNGLKKITYRDVDKDLDLYPILEGPTYRPVFDIKED